MFIASGPGVLTILYSLFFNFHSWAWEFVAKEQNVFAVKFSNLLVKKGKKYLLTKKECLLELALGGNNSIFLLVKIYLTVHLHHACLA